MYRTPYLFLLPALLALGLISFWPVSQAIYLSFTEYDIIEVPRWIGLENYQRLIGDRRFWEVLGNTLVYLATVVPLLVLLPLGLAIAVNQKLKGIHWFRVAYYVPVIVSIVVAGIAWKWIYAESGLLNYILSWLAFQPVRISWLTQPNLALVAIAMVTVWKGLGYYMVIYLAGLQSIPANLYEAAMIDGSDGWERHWDITIPLMQPYIILVSVLSSIAAMKVFEEIYVMSRGGPANSTKTVVYYLYERGFSNLDMGYAAAIGTVLFLVILLLSLSTVRLIYLRPPG
ncbi:MAG: sugar ABC transporter permease [Cyanobacteria bacterium P01_D01_bin.123]